MRVEVEGLVYPFVFTIDMESFKLEVALSILKYNYREVISPKKQKGKMQVV